MAEKMKQEALFWTQKKVSGRIKAMLQWNMLSARLQTTDHDMIPSGRVGAWRSLEDCWTAFGRNRLFHYYTDIKLNPFRVACSEQACCANSSRMNSSNHLPWNLAHAHLLHSWRGTSPVLQEYRTKMGGNQGKHWFDAFSHQGKLLFWSFLSRPTNFVGLDKKL